MDINSGDDLLDVAYVHKQTSETRSKYLIFYPSLTWAQSFYSEPSIFCPLLNFILQTFPHSLGDFFLFDFIQKHNIHILLLLICSAIELY